MKADLVQSYLAAQTVARTRARNFYYSFLVLPPEKRRAFCAVYAFMRFCDDVSDGNGSVEDKRRMLAEWRSRLDACIRGEAAGHAILPAFRDTMERFSIPADYFHWIIDGAEMDLTVDRYQTFDDLYRYCFRVASAVGLVSIQIFGFQGEEAKTYAEQCGVAFQLTNILRDLKEDASLGRVYLPLEDLERFGYAEQELQKGIRDERFLNLMAFETERAQQYYAQARNLLPLVDRSSRPALWTMMEIYRRLLEKIVRRDYDVFGERIRLSRAEKTSIVLRALAMRWLRGGTAPL